MLQLVSTAICYVVAATMLLLQKVMMSAHMNLCMPTCQAAFHVFGMELLAKLDLAATNAFFRTFFRLPDFYWRGFLSSSLTSAQLIAFALLTFVLAPAQIQLALMRHLITNPAGAYLIRHYLGAVPCCLLHT